MHSTTAIKLNAPPKINDATSRTNGVSADKNSIDNMPSFTSVMAFQVSMERSTAPATPRESSTPARQPPMATTPTATKAPAAPSITSTEKSAPLLPHLAVDKKDKEAKVASASFAQSNFRKWLDLVGLRHWRVSAAHLF